MFNLEKLLIIKDHADIVYKYYNPYKAIHKIKQAKINALIDCHSKLDYENYNTKKNEKLIIGKNSYYIFLVFDYKNQRFRFQDMLKDHREHCIRRINSQIKNHMFWKQNGFEVVDKKIIYLFRLDSYEINNRQRINRIKNNDIYIIKINETLKLCNAKGDLL
jgi:hypothetical protein